MNPDNQLRRILTSIAPILALALFATPLSAEEFISNGSFEEGTIPVSHEAVVNSNVTGWTTGGTGGIVWYMVSSVWGGGGPAGGGDMLVNVNGNTTLWQSFTVVAGTEYTVSYWTQRRGFGGYMFTTLSVDAGTVAGAGGFTTDISQPTAASIDQATATQAEPVWEQYGFTFTPDTTTTATLTFGNEYVDGDHGDNDGIYVDLVSVTGGAGGTAPVITGIEVLGSGDVVLTTDVAAASLTDVLQSNGLTSFTSVAFAVTDTNKVTISAANVDPNADGADYYRVQH